MPVCQKNEKNGALLNSLYTIGSNGEPLPSKSVIYMHFLRFCGDIRV